MAADDVVWDLVWGSEMDKRMNDYILEHCVFRRKRRRELEDEIIRRVLRALQPPPAPPMPEDKRKWGLAREPRWGDLDSDVKLEHWRRKPHHQWRKLLYDWADDTRRHGSWHSLQFRKEFGMARQVFDKLVEAAEANPAICSDDNRPRAAKAVAGSVGRGNPSVPLIYKMAGAYFVLTKNVTFHVAASMAGMGDDTLARFFHTYMTWARCNEVPKHVYLPQGDHLRFVMYCYEQMGFPGACCSTDGVHVGWAKCPHDQFWLHKGEKKYPTRLYNISVGPSTEVVYVPQSFPGRNNDKTAAKTHYVLRGLQDRTLYSGDSVPALHRLRKASTSTSPSSSTSTSTAYL